MSARLIDLRAEFAMRQVENSAARVVRIGEAMIADIEARTNDTRQRISDLLADIDADVRRTGDGPGRAA